MRTRHLQTAMPSAFTLAELLVAMTVLALISILLVSLLGGVNRAWISGEQQVETFQDGRAILELITREISQAVISPRLQMVANPSLVGTSGSQVNRSNSGSLFWQSTATPTASGNLCEVGYYLTDAFQLKRFFVPPADSSNYQILSNPPNDRTALWVANAATTPALSTVVSDNVIGFWIRCLDVNGDPIPWLSSAATADGDTGATPLQFNSAAHFQPAVRGQSNSFKYTAQSSTIQAHQLPSAVELTLVTLDSKTMDRVRTSIPALPTLTGPQDIPTAVTTFNQALVANNVRNARTFSTRVAVKGSDQ